MRVTVWSPCVCAWSMIFDRLPLASLAVQAVLAAAEEDWKKAVETQRIAKRAAADGEDERRKDGDSPANPE